MMKTPSILPFDPAAPAPDPSEQSKPLDHADTPSFADAMKEAETAQPQASRARARARGQAANSLGQDETGPCPARPTPAGRTARSWQQRSSPIDAGQSTLAPTPTATARPPAQSGDGDNGELGTGAAKQGMTSDASGTDSSGETTGSLALAAASEEPGSDVSESPHLVLLPSVAAPATILSLPVESAAAAVAASVSAPPLPSTASPHAESGESIRELPISQRVPVGAIVQSSEAGSPVPAELRSVGLETLSNRERLAFQLRAALNQMENHDDPASVEPEASSKIIPFPTAAAQESNILPVQFRPDQMGGVVAMPGTEIETAADETQLPTPEADPENSAPHESSGDDPATPVPVSPNSSRTSQSSENAKDSGSDRRTERISEGNSERGTSAAGKDQNMESPNASDSIRSAEGRAETVFPGSASARGGGAGEAPGATLLDSPRSGERLRDDWAIPAGLSRMEGSVQSLEIEVQGPDAAGAVERISRMMGREAVVFRQSGTDSMSVMLRPDANTELMVHLSQRNGQIEASVRCERGDFHQLNALWSQLQEALAQQKVRLAPLQEAASDTTQFRNSGGGFSSPERDDTSGQSRDNSDFMEEWPAPASPDQHPAHVRSRRESGHRLSTSRPGWETWA